MVFPIPSRLATSLFVVGLAMLMMTGPSRAEEQADPSAARMKAKTLFDEGTVLYDRGRYDEAIERFQETYRLWADPLVIFAMAQAQRLKGDCGAAKERYTEFTKLSEPSPVRNEAEVYLQQLKSTCVRHPPEVPACSTCALSASAELALPHSASSDTSNHLRYDAEMASPVTVEKTGRRNTDPSPRVTLIATLGGLLVSTAGLGTYFWNTSRLDRWRTEDAWLGSEAARSSTASEVMRRQDANDQLSRSIHRYDQFSLGFVIAGVAMLATTAVIHLLILR